MGKKVFKHRVWLIILLVLLIIVFFSKVNVDSSFENKVKKYSLESLLGYSKVQWRCLETDSKCANKEALITHNSNDIKLICAEIFNSESMLRRLFTGDYRITLPLPGIVKEKIPTKSIIFNKTELYQQCIATGSATVDSLVARVTASGMVFKVYSDELGVVSATTVLTKRE